LCETVSDKVVWHSLAYLIMHKWVVGGGRFKRIFCAERHPPLQRQRMPAMHRSTTNMWRTSYLHRSEYNAVWNL